VKLASAEAIDVTDSAGYLHDLDKLQNPPPAMFRFTIRDVVWLMIALAVSFGWWLEHRTATQAIARFQAVKREHNALVEALDRVGLTCSIRIAAEGKARWAVERKDGSPVNANQP
jgi:hypothetical protein